MSVHQIIYTSCMRGIDGVNDGQQVYSYDAGFQGAGSDEVKSLFTYQPPALEPGVVMTEELARTMPRSFTYRRLENGACALALNTYLGRDYMGSAGRFGNHLSHVVVAGREDMLHYPCEFYGSGLLRDHMEYEEVNNPQRPEYLPAPVLERGYAVDIDRVVEFLGVEGRMEILKNMVCAVLSFETERKRLLICDEPENILLWIAAVEYTLPLPAALDLNFTTYAFDPSLSASQICGVVPQGTRFGPESARQHFVFDLLGDSCPELEKDGRYYDFLETSLSFSYDSLEDFHRFLTEGYSYAKAGSQLVEAYCLYTLLSDGLTSLAGEELEGALEFAVKYGLPGEKSQVLENILSQRECLLELEAPLLLKAARFSMSLYSVVDEGLRAQIRELLVDRVLWDFLYSQEGEEGFLAFYQALDSLCQGGGFSLATQLMEESNREKLLAAMKDSGALWKLAFIPRVVTAYVKDQDLSVEQLLPDTPLGQTYCGLVQVVAAQSAANGQYLVQQILDGFAGQWDYLMSMALNLEGVLLDQPGGEQGAEAMWRHVEQRMAGAPAEGRRQAMALLMREQRYEMVFQLYSQAMAQARELEECQRTFQDHYREFVAQGSAYAAYAGPVMECYYERLRRFDRKASRAAVVELFQTLADSGSGAPFGERLVQELACEIPFAGPSRENERFIQTAYTYLHRMGRPIEGRLSLLLAGMVLEACGKPGQIGEAKDTLCQMLQAGGADLGGLSQREAEEYFSWVLPRGCSMCGNGRDIQDLFGLFRMPAAVEPLFFSQCARIFLKQGRSGRDSRDYPMFCVFLSLVFQRGTPQVLQSVGKAVGRLNKQKLAELDDSVRAVYGRDRASLRMWERVREEAASASPILENLTNLFKWRKDKP